MIGIVGYGANVAERPQKIQETLIMVTLWIRKENQGRKYISKKQ